MLQVIATRALALALVVVVLFMVFTRSTPLMIHAWPFLSLPAASRVVTTTVLTRPTTILATTSALLPSSASTFSLSTLSSSSSLHAQQQQPQHNNDNADEDIYAAVHRKQHEMKQVRAQHASTTDPIRMAMSYAQESVSPMRLAKALRRVYEDPHNPANPKAIAKSDEQGRYREEQLAAVGMADLGMRRPSLVVDIKRRSMSRPGQVLCTFDDAGMVAEAMARLGADAVFINTDYSAYCGDLTELKSAVRAIRGLTSETERNTAVVMKDIVVDEIQLGLAKEAGADGIVLMSSVLGPALDNFLDLATAIGLETIVECHTRNEVERALEILAPNILVNNYDRLSRAYYPNQAIQLAGLFPGSGGPVICLATGGIGTVDQMKRHLSVGYDGLVLGRALMGRTEAPTLIRAVRDRTLLPAELSQWGLEDVEFDLNGNIITGLEGSRRAPDPRTEGR